MKLITYIFFFLLIAQISFAQNKAKIDSLKKLGRDSLISLAVKELNEPGFDPNAYDRIIVKASSTDVIVSFDLSVTFVSKIACFYSSVDVSLIDSGSSRSVKGDCDVPKYYKVSDSIKKKIDFVFDCINKENEIGDIPDRKLDYGEDMEITEQGDHYYIEVSGWSTFSHYKIEKGTGKIYEAGHKHYDRSGYEEEKYEIIK